MSNEIEVKIPDIGGATQVDVIEIMVQVGDQIEIDTPLITLESDKASMEIPSPVAGKVTKLNLKVGDKVSEGDLILVATVEKNLENTKENAPQDLKKDEQESTKNKSIQTDTNQVSPEKKSERVEEVKIPDIGGAAKVDVIEVMVKPGDQIEVDAPLITLESEKASMEIPSPVAGKVTQVSVKVGDKVSEGDLILVAVVESGSGAGQTDTIVSKPEQKSEPVRTKSVEEHTNRENEEAPSQFVPAGTVESAKVIAAGPAVRRIAREFGVNLADVRGTGRKDRITKEDVQAYVKERLNKEPSTGSFGIPPAPVIDFTQFGEVETKPLNKIKRLTGANVHRAWITIPHVTQFDSADITEIEAFRKSEAEHAKAKGYKLTLLAFVCAVVSKALKEFPQFNASLDAAGANLVYKKYYNIGIAVETPNGLVVPVIKNVDKLSVAEIATEMTRLSTKARDKGLMPTDMSGGCFTISSLGGIGGTSFTPIVNSPEVAILGLSRSEIKPVYENGAFQPRLMLPLSLSYDHRVIDGAEAARFTRFICDCLSDIRRILL
ncbi:dihydrolipoyllysine-residue acetyltransferase [Fluoribacter dumoffii]|uniref:Acetyltransferase component of pyruvate dehydrogenase complex n=1 Tax=Fluoribacter dumoffii TaxID=463 RepID=A0A377G9P9_9GAMM|nr:dihydrolipoyllysine-residue acetyltransferase [Fluoribacter dumoffii]KTC89059.1 Pyruvate dehydrogenase (dihydrolipoyltransacetylase component) E2p [Fluoribacter dumoffii NY 23]MCW8385733.1 dihydrolipoyllysine-residue acetyltransferase [Fluoribacter dumoffii]MCW8418763.1 dihydrolipoyllysine-residue acetyltransferase [Fluoribacter dumoffii]MCW8453393.1 dihydrolipoyllysine-residue acetyltransferase [Fluoribacter dumoffii]MCW8459387.1 dihydrolipoyllysine-residue acetyltransferase [Fluoribacter 